MTESVVLGGMGIIVPSKLSRKIFPHLLDAFQRGWIILSLNAVHIVSDFIHKILQRLQIISIIGGVFIVFYTIAVEGAVDFRFLRKKTPFFRNSRR